MKAEATASESSKVADMTESSEFDDRRFFVSATLVTVLLFFLAVSLTRTLGDGGSCG